MNRKQRKRLAILLIGVVMIVGLGGGLYALSKANKARRIERALQEGMTAYQAGDYPDAMKKLSEAVSGAPSAEAITALADARSHVPEDDGKHLATAIRYAAEAVSKNPEYLPARELLVRLYGQVQRNPEVLDASEAVLAKDPDNLVALRERALALGRLGRSEEAIKVQERLITADPADFEHVRVMIALLGRDGRKPDELLAYLGSLPQSAHELPAYWSTAAQLALFTGDTQTAVESVTKAIDLGVSSPEAFDQLLDVILQVRMTDPAAASASLGLMAKLSELPQWTSELGVVAADRAWHMGDASAAAAWLPDIESLVQLPEETVGRAAMVLGWLGREDEADRCRRIVEQCDRPLCQDWKRILEAAQAIGRDEPAAAIDTLEQIASPAVEPETVRYLTARAYFAMGEHRAAAAALGDLPGEARWHIARRLRAAISLLEGDPSLAVQLLQADMRVTPSLDSVLLFARAAVDLAEQENATRQQRDEAVTVLERLSDQIPDAPLLKLLLARALAAAGDPALGAQLAIGVLDDQPRPPSSELVTAAQRLMDHAPEAADRLLLACYEANPGDPEAVFARASQLAMRGDVDAGRQLIEDAQRQAVAGENDVGLDLRLAIFATRYQQADGPALLAQAAQKHPDSAAAQRALLDSSQSWTPENKNAVLAAVERLRALTGESGLQWQLYHAQYVIRYAARELAPATLKRIAQITQQHPAHARAHALMGELWLMEGDRPRAIASFERAVNLGNEGLAALPRLIELLQLVGRVQEAKQRLTQFAQIDQLNPEFRNARAALLLRQGMWQEAMADLEALGQSTSPDLLVQLAELQLRNNDQARARQTLEQFLARQHLKPGTAADAAVLFSRLGDDASARSLLAELPDTPPDRIRTITTASWLGRIGRVDEAEQLLHAMGDSTPAAVTLGRLYISVGRYAEAGALADRALEQEPENPALQEVKALAVLGSEGSSADPASLARLSEIWAGSDESGVASRLSQILRADTSNPQEAQRAIAALRSLTRDEPTFLPAWRVLVALLVRQGRSDEAVDVAYEAARFNPADPEVARFAAGALFDAGRLTDAYSMAKDWESRVGRSFETDAFLALIEVALDDYAQARARLDPWSDRIREEADSGPDLFTLYARTLGATGRHAAAHDMLWPKAQESEDWAMRYLGAVSQLLDQPAVAREWMTRVEPELAQTDNALRTLAFQWYRLASVSGRDEDYQRVTEIAKRVTGTSPENGIVHLMAASAFENMDDSAGAEGAYRAGLELMPDHEQALNNLANLLASESRDLDEAARFAQRALEVAQAKGASGPAISPYHDTLGYVRLKAGDFEAAEQSMRLAVEADTLRLSPVIGLSEALLELGRPDEAEEVLRRFERVGGDLTNADDRERARLDGLRHRLQESR